VLALLILVALGTSVHLYRSQEARERVCRWAQEMRARSVNYFSKVVFALYRSQEARTRVCRWAQEMRARSVNDCFEGRLFSSFSLIGATATAPLSFIKGVMLFCYFFGKLQYFRTSHLLAHVAHNPMAIFPPTVYSFWMKQKPPALHFFPSLAETSCDKNLQFSRLPVVLGGRRREDSTLLVSGMNTNMESLSDEDDFA
jgi:hypothetical protein